jgi:hypothetical protein
MKKRHCQKTDVNLPDMTFKRTDVIEMPKSQFANPKLQTNSNYQILKTFKGFGYHDSVCDRCFVN